MNNFVFKVDNSKALTMQNTPFLFEHALQEYIIIHQKELLTLSNNMKEPEIKWAEKKVKNARYDLVVHYNDADITAVCELKRGLIDMRAYKQIRKYLQTSSSLQFDCGILIGTSITNEIIEEVLKSKDTYAIIINRFDYNEYENVSTVIYSPRKMKRDYTKYTLITSSSNTIRDLAKGKLVYEIIRAYIAEHSPCTILELQKEFPSELAKRGSESKMPIIIENNLKGDDPLCIRYFKTPLECADGNILICNQWGIGNIDRMIDKATEELGMKIITQN